MNRWSGVSIDFRLIDCDGNILVLDVESQAIEEAHVNIRYPDKREPCDQITSPPGIEHLKLCDEKKERRDIMAEAVLACEEIKEFARDESVAVLALIPAPFPRLTEDFLVRDGPSDAGHRQGQDEEIGKLGGKRHWHSLLAMRCIPEV